MVLPYAATSFGLRDINHSRIDIALRGDPAASSAASAVTPKEEF
jgi:hypothetical protein